MKEMGNREEVGYYEVREAERLFGHYMLMMAILGDEDEAHSDTGPLRQVPRRRASVAVQYEAAEIAG